MSTITELLNDQRDKERQEASPAVQTQGATTNSDTAPDDPCCTPIGPDPGPDR
jgi:hypothetical protein